MKKYLLRIDAVNLDNFVYDTNDLSTIRGGSLLLLDCIEILSNSFKDNLHSIATGASAGLFWFNADDETNAEKTRETVEDFLKGNVVIDGHTYELKHATFVVDVQPVTGSFLHDYESVIAKNRWRQMRSPSLAIPSQNAVGKGYCDIDLVRPAEKDSVIAGKESRISSSVNTRREYGIRQKYQFYRKRTGINIGDNFVNNLDELTFNPSSKLHHKMAVIYIDGNGFGTLRRKECDTEEKLNKFDNYIKDKRKEMLTEFLKDVVMQDKAGWESSGKYRIETLVWGGDEIVWVVPAWKGWETLSFFYQKAKAWEIFSSKLTHAAGIVFCHHNAPISRIKELAHKLAELAKYDRTRNLFAYQVLESFDHIGRDLERFRRQRCPEDCDANSLILDGEAMRDMEMVVSKLKRNEKFSTGKMHEIAMSLLDEPSRARSEIDRLDKDIMEILDEGKNYYNGASALWVHLQELWDYLAVRNEP